MFRLLGSAALSALACGLALAITLGVSSAATRDPFSPACISYYYEGSRFDEGSRLRLKRDCARFLAAGIREGVATRDWDRVASRQDWAVHYLGVCGGADDELACARKLDTVGSLTPAEPRRAPAPRRPGPQVPPKVAAPSAPSPTPDAGAGGVLAFLAVLLVFVLVGLVVKGLGKRASEEVAQGGGSMEADDRRGQISQEMSSRRVKQIRFLVNEAVKAGYLFEQDGTMVSTSEGYNRAGLAVLGAMVLNIGEATFNTYCENQLRAIGWVKSKASPVQAEARELRAKRRGNDPSVRSMFEDVEREFVGPLVAEHVKERGRGPSVDAVEGTCAMLLAKILWDLKLGNPDLAAVLRMVRGTGESELVRG